jgi:hypothetical protein
MIRNWLKNTPLRTFCYSRPKKNSVHRTLPAPPTPHQIIRYFFHPVNQKSHVGQDSIIIPSNWDWVLGLYYADMHPPAHNPPPLFIVPLLLTCIVCPAATADNFRDPHALSWWRSPWRISAGSNTIIQFWGKIIVFLYDILSPSSRPKLLTRLHPTKN